MKCDDTFVSVIICTRDRPAAFQRALASVRAQDFDEYEIIVVDGSDPPLEEPEPNGVELRLIGGQREGEGAARSTGLRAARGRLIAWCDDDDEWSPDHLRRLRDELLAHPKADMVYSASVEPGPRPGSRIRGNTANARREIVQPPGFAIQAGDVLHRAQPVRDMGGFDRHLATFAAGDLWSRIYATSRILRIPMELTIHHTEPSRVLPEDRRAAWGRLIREWRSISAGTQTTERRITARRPLIVPFNPDTWREGRREMAFQGQVKDWGSYSIVTRAMIQALQNAGVGVRMGPRREGPYEPERAALAAPANPQERICFVYDWRTGAAEPLSEINLLYGMWETTVIPAYQVNEINAAATLLYVPSREMLQIARNSGVSTPGKVLVHGVDAKRFPYLERHRTGSEPYTFGTHGMFGRRKGIDVLVHAFREEFAPHEHVRLVLKNAWRSFEEQKPEDERIIHIGGFLRGEAFYDFFRGLDAYVLPSRGEGFGLTGLEAMATGLPLIATNWSGPVEYLDPSDTYPLRYQLVETGGTWFSGRRQLGCWAEPDVEHLRELLRYCFEHRAEVADAGRRASARAHRDWTWERVARQMIADFDLLARGVTPV